MRERRKISRPDMEAFFETAATEAFNVIPAPVDEPE